MNDPQSPRDWLLARHASVRPQLDALRRAELPRPGLTWREFTVQLFAPHRRLWQALALTWFALLVLRFVSPETAPSGPARPSVPAALVNWRDQSHLHDALAQTSPRR